MAVCSSISISQVEYLRLDADFYHPKYLQELETWRTLDERIGVAKLSHLISAPVRTGRTPSARHIKEEDEIVPFIKTDGIREGRINFDSAGELPKRVLNGTDFIPADSVVVTIIGATPEIVGRAAIVRDADPRCVTNQNVAVITTNSKCDPYFLTAYLQTSFGRDQLWRHSRRTEQVNLNCREVERVLVPTPVISLQNEIGDMVRASFAATDDSESLYTQAQQLLESELGLDRLRFDKPVGYTARFSELELSRRADAEFFNPEYQAIISVAKEHSHSLLGRLFSIRRGVCIDPRLYNEEIGRPYIRIKELSLNQPLSKDDSVRIDEKYVLAAYPQARAGDYILAVIGATIGKINLISGELDGSLFSNNTACLSPKLHIEQPNAYELLLRSEIIQKQIQQRMAKTAQEKISDPELKRILVPTLPKPALEQLENLVVSSKQNHFLSKQLLDQAKSRVEQLIEEAVQA
jgi:restriction endonuclease S subunit